MDMIRAVLATAQTAVSIVAGLLVVWGLIQAGLGFKSGTGPQMEQGALCFGAGLIVGAAAVYLGTIVP